MSILDRVNFRLPLWAHLSLSTVGFVLGGVGACVFGVALSNWHAAAWSLAGALAALGCLHLHSLARYGALAVRHTSSGVLRFRTAGMVGAGLSAVGKLKKIYVTIPTLQYTRKKTNI